jgi:hypothetical protein
VLSHLYVVCTLPGGTMERTNGSDDWRVLCEMASKEMDSDKLLDLVTKINLVLDKNNLQSRYGKIAIQSIIPPQSA